MKLRLALRAEGQAWNAYIAQEHSMENAFFIGSIPLHVVHQDERIAEDFINLMQRVMAISIKEACGKEPTEWVIKPAPESERPGNA